MTVDVIARDPSFNDGQIRFTTVPLKPFAFLRKKNGDIFHIIASNKGLKATVVHFLP